MLCQFLLYSKVNQLYIYMYILFSRFFPIRSLQSIEQRSLCYAVAQILILKQVTALQQGAMSSLGLQFSLLNSNMHAETSGTSKYLLLRYSSHLLRFYYYQPLVFLLGESQGQQSLVGCHLWGRTESDTTEAPQQQQQPLGQIFCIGYFN